jgi:hypothetical protein
LARILQRVQLDRRRPFQAFQQPLGPVLVHHEPDRAAVHAEDRHPARHIVVQRLEHQPVAAQRHDHVGLALVDVAVAFLQLREGGLRGFAAGSDEGDLAEGHGASIRSWWEKLTA